MTDKLWKSVERRVAAFLGGIRVPITGRQRGATPDVEHPFFSIEVKHRETMPFWILDAMDQADAVGRADRLPLVVLHMKGQAIEDSLTVMRLSDILKMYRELQAFYYNDYNKLI